MTKLKHGALRSDRGRDGRYVRSVPCDACGKPTNEATRATDDEVCGGSDAPGFYLCDRKRCGARIPADAEERRAYYAAQRALNDAAQRPCSESFPRRRSGEGVFRAGICADDVKKLAALPVVET